MHCHRMHHSLLHLAEEEIDNVTNDLAPVADDSEAQKSDTFSSIGIATVANVQAMSMKVPRTFYILLAWIALHTAEGCCVKVRAMFDQGSTLSFISEFLCQTLRTTQQCADLQIHYFGKDYTGHASSKVVLA